MRLCIIGVGYVGLVSGTCFAEMGNEVVCMDIDPSRIDRLNSGQVPIYEPGLAEMVRRNAGQGRLRFSTDLKSAVEESQIIFIAVGTPQGEDGASDLTYVLTAAEQVARAMNGYKIVVNKSTVPVGTAERVKERIAALTKHPFHVVSNPEFLKEGAAIEDFMRPDRVVIGVARSEQEVAEVMEELYAPFTRSGAPVLVMDLRSAEMTKYAANAMLATRVSFMNEVANLCDHLGADVHWVRQGVGLDPRIGRSFLFAGVGYGGSCFPKDIRALIAIADEHKYPLKLIRAVDQVNQLQKRVMIDKILKFFASTIPQQLETEGPPADPTGEENIPRVRATHFTPFSLAQDEIDLAYESGAETEDSGDPPLQGRSFALWGLAFKPGTDDMREAPSLVIIRKLLELGARVTAYDPEATDQARALLGDRIDYAQDPYAALVNADALLLVTEWHLFRNPDFSRMRRLLKLPVIFDGRNQYNPGEMRAHGFLYFGIGRP